MSEPVPHHRGCWKDTNTARLLSQVRRLRGRREDSPPCHPAMALSLSGCLPGGPPQHPDTSSLREKGFAQLTVSGYTPPLGGLTGGQVLEAAGQHTRSEQRAMMGARTLVLESRTPKLREWGHPQWVGLQHRSLDQDSPHKHSRRPSRMILG